MSTKADETLFDEMHGALAKTLLNRIKDGTATAADLSVARQFLKDNAVQAAPVKGSPLQGLADGMPTFDDNPLPRH